MRKFILIAALVLASASAQAAGMRGLTLASSDDQATADQPKAVEAASASLSRRRNMSTGLPL